MKHTYHSRKKTENIYIRKEKLSRYPYRWLGGGLLFAIALPRKKTENIYIRKEKLSRYPYRWLGGGLLFAIALLCVVSLLPGASAEGADGRQASAVSYESVLICRGDSLWSIAEANLEDATNAEIRAYVDELIQLNNISSSCIHAGNYLLVPKYSEE